MQNFEKFVKEHSKNGMMPVTNVREVWDLAQKEIAKQLVKLPVNQALSILEKLSSR